MLQTLAIIVAAGRGTRMGSATPKQFRALLGKPVIAWSADVFRSHPDITSLAIVRPPGSADDFQVLDKLCDFVVEGGKTRSESVRNGLNIPDITGFDRVLIHDAARPGLTHAIITSLLEALDTSDAAAPALRVSDALKDTSGETLITIDRTPLRRVQTPQAFHMQDIRTALDLKDQKFVDDLAAIEAMGKTVTLIAGTEQLSKLTYEEDFAHMEKLLSPTHKPPRMGTGYDVHQFGPGDHVTLCGVKIPHTHGLVGHSDADIGWHALTDAILGAMAMGDIGDHFPPSDPQWKDADSGTFLLHAAKLAEREGYRVSNVDITLVCEAPKIKPHREAMRQRTADLLGIPLSSVSVKATTTEALGFEGRREGMSGQAAAVLTPLPDQG